MPPPDFFRAQLSASAPAPGTRVEVKIRSQHAPAEATIEDSESGARVRFDQPQSAVAPGQLAVIYQGDRVLGGGPIERALHSAA